MIIEIKEKEVEKITPIDDEEEGDEDEDFPEEEDGDEYFPDDF